MSTFLLKRISVSIMHLWPSRISQISKIALTRGMSCYGKHDVFVKSTRKMVKGKILIKICFFSKHKGVLLHISGITMY